MHTRQGAAEPARTEPNRALSVTQEPIAREYPFAHVLGEGPNRSRITVGPRWLEFLLILFVASERRLEKLDTVWMVLAGSALLGSAVAIALLLLEG